MLGRRRSLLICAFALLALHLPQTCESKGEALSSSQVLTESVASRTPKKYRCVFLHGIGYLVTGPPNASDVEGYWGGDEVVRQNTQQCSSWTFVHQDTVHRAWNDTSLVKAFCDAAINGPDKAIVDTLVFTHSQYNSN